MFVPPDCTYWLLWREADGPLNVFEASTGLFPVLTGRELTFEEAIDWFQFIYTADQVGAYVAQASMVLTQSVLSSL